MLSNFATFVQGFTKFAILHFRIHRGFHFYSYMWTFHNETYHDVIFHNGTSYNGASHNGTYFYFLDFFLYIFLIVTPWGILDNKVIKSGY